MDDKAKIHQKVREAIQAGKPPNRRPQRMSGGPGTGARCVICGDSIGQAFEMRLEFAGDDGDPAEVKYHFHVSCYTAWDSERCKFDGMACGTRVGGDRTQLGGSRAPAADAVPGSDPGTTPGRRGLPVASDDPKMHDCEGDSKSKPRPERA
jgi:hypothetical protein